MLTNVRTKFRILNFMKTLFHKIHRQTDRFKEASGRYLKLVCERAKKREDSERYIEVEGCENENRSAWCYNELKYID